jgi:hypothetical protein
MAENTNGGNMTWSHSWNGQPNAVLAEAQEARGAERVKVIDEKDAARNALDRQFAAIESAITKIGETIPADRAITVTAFGSVTEKGGGSFTLEISEAE